MINGVVFDMDGLLIDSEALFDQQAQIILPKLGHVYSRALLQSCTGLPHDKVVEKVIAHYGEGTAVEEIFHQVEQSMLAHYQTQGVPVKQGVFELMEYLHEQNIIMAVASSTYRSIATNILNISGIAKYIAHDVFGDEVAHGKPAPDIYLAATKKLGLDPSCCMGLEDSYNGLHAAKSAGLYTVMIPDLLPPTDDIIEEIDGCAESLLDIIPMIKVFNNIQ